MATNQHQIQELENYLTAFAELKNKAVEAVPEIKSQIELMLSGVSEGNKKLIKGISESGEQLYQNLNKGGKELYKNINEVSEEIKNSSNILLNKNEEIQRELEQIQTTLHKSFEELMQSHISENSKLMQRLEIESKNALSFTTQSVNDQLKLIDESMQNEVNRVMNEMGRALATITRQFTNDYQELVNAMRNITSYRNRG